MTMPHLHNCPHDPDGWCLDCVKKLAAEREEARDWVRRMHNETQILTCVYCGHAYPPGTPSSGSDALTAHIKVCTKHPMRGLEGRVKNLEDAIQRAYVPLQQLAGNPRLMRIAGPARQALNILTPVCKPSRLPKQSTS